MIEEEKTSEEYIEEVSSLFKTYIKSEDKTEITSKILDAIKNSKRFDVGRCICESSDDLCKKINILENEILANDSLNDYNNELLRNPGSSNSVLLQMIAQTALTMSEDSESNAINNEIKDVWLNVFKDVTDFPKLFDEKFNYWENWRKENFKKYANTEQTIEIKETIDTFSVLIPIELNERDLGATKKVNLEYLDDSMVYKLIKDFNDFELDSYMELNYVNKLTLSKNNENWEFKVDCNKEVSNEEKSEFLEDLVGQLVDGWGEGQEQKYKLIGDKEYNLYFDYKNANILTTTKSRKKLK